MAVPAPRDLFGTRIPESLFGPVMLVARLFLASEFMLFGIRKFLHPDIIATQMSAHYIPGELIWAVIPFQFFFGWMIAFGFQTRIASLMLCWFCIVAPSIFHTHNLDNWARDIASAGGWIFIAAFGPGPWSVDAMIDVPGQLILGATRAEDRRVHIALMVGRVLMAVYFLSCGLRDAMGMGPVVGYFTAHDLGWLLNFGIALQLICGAMILGGWNIRPACLAAAAYSLLLSATVRSPGAEVFAGDGGFDVFIHGLFNGSLIGTYFKDITVAGALLALFANGPGPIALKARRRRAELTV